MAKKQGPVLSVGRGEKLPISKGAGLTAKGGTGRTVTTIQSGLEYFGSMPMM